VRHLDWSADSSMIQSVCGAYELLCHEAATGKQVRGGLEQPGTGRCPMCAILHCSADLTPRQPVPLCSPCTRLHAAESACSDDSSWKLLEALSSCQQVSSRLTDTSPWLAPQVKANLRDARWASWTSMLGFPAMGIWRRYSDGTDINAVDRTATVARGSDGSERDYLAGQGPYLATCGDDGRVRLFAYPCVVENAASRWA
jgi:hypothetical protein